MLTACEKIRKAAKKGGEAAAKVCTTHGGSKEKLYHRWRLLITQCYDKNYHGYKKYGALGIELCELWKNDYGKFRDWSKSKGITEENIHSYTLKRLNNNEDFSEENCYWGGNKMSKIGHACKDENGKYSGGKAGDQTGKEVCTTAWYKRPFPVVLIHPDEKIREKLAKAMEAACANNHIGYDQDSSKSNDAGRYSLFQAARKVGFDFSKITVDCETDCSNLVAACCNAAGLEVSEYIYTGNEKSALTKVGFVAYTDKKYTDSPDYLPRGAVLLYEGHHTAINLEDGKYVTKTSTPTYTETKIVAKSLEIVGTAALNVRSGPGTSYGIKKSLKRGAKVSATAKAKVDDTTWFKIGTDQWISGKYIEGWIQETTDDNQWWYVKLGYKFDTNKVVTIGGKQYIFDKNGYMVTASRIATDGSIKY